MSPGEKGVPSHEKDLLHRETVKQCKPGNWMVLSAARKTLTVPKVVQNI